VVPSVCVTVPFMPEILWPSGWGAGDARLSRCSRCYVTSPASANVGYRSRLCRARSYRLVVLVDRTSGILLVTKAGSGLDVTA